VSETVYSCPPLRARLRAESCASNHERAVEASKHPKREGSHSVLLSLRCCVNCCGVVELARMWGREPEEIEVKPRALPPIGKGVKKDKPRIARSLGMDQTIPPAARKLPCWTLTEVARRAGTDAASAKLGMRSQGIEGQRVGKSRLYTIVEASRWLEARAERRRRKSA